MRSRWFGRDEREKGREKRKGSWNYVHGLSIFYSHAVLELGTYLDSRFLMYGKKKGEKGMKKISGWALNGLTFSRGQRRRFFSIIVLEMFGLSPQSTGLYF